MVSGDFQSLSAFWYPQLSFMVMQVSQARPALAGLISCSGVVKSPGRPLRLLTMMSGCNLNTILFIFSRFPLFRAERPIDVVPEDVNLSVLRHQFADQAVGVFHKAHTRRLIRQATSAIGVVPIHQGIVKAHAQALGARRFHEFRHQIAAARLPAERNSW